MMRKLLTAAVLTSLFLAGCQKEAPSSHSTVKEETKPTQSSAAEYPKAYNFTFTDVNGHKHHLSDFKGKVVIVQFFGTYCPPCRMEMPVLNKIYKEYNGKVVVIGLSVDYSGRPPQELKPFVEKMKLSYLVGPAPEKAWVNYAGKITGLDSIPQTYFINKKGEIVYYEVGFAPSYEELFQKAVEKLLKEDDGNQSGHEG
ncbi:Redoxin domain protein [Thermovibrio ammonificans HB-1]|uniref:Redoxin domain protein n=1 Tax=Thermovibrio ammonificans (strain DSM 15698 / JCM 12110 / HB-1) TaxID=648996 RepID=E8T4A5_THEA1|nr:TlpA disulfide reductase family protein [Thermovibrio ammonificans]ADU97434.1 Redoxin domain protein [Thermovibrio ammonificans HB-1]